MKYKRHFQHCNSAILVVLSCVDPSQSSESTQRVEKAFIISACGFSFLFSKQPLCKRSRRETKTAEWWLGGEPERDPQSTRSCFRPSHIWGPLCLSLSSQLSWLSALHTPADPDFTHNECEALQSSVFTADSSTAWRGSWALFVPPLTADDEWKLRWNISLHGVFETDFMNLKMKHLDIDFYIFADLFFTPESDSEIHPYVFLKYVFLDYFSTSNKLTLAGRKHVCTSQSQQQASFF